MRKPSKKKRNLNNLSSTLLFRILRILQKEIMSKSNTIFPLKILGWGTFLLSFLKTKQSSSHKIT
jgi:hypothetical protein